MLSDEATATTGSDGVGSARVRKRRGGERSTVAGNLTAFVTTFGLVLAYALRGGSFDIVAFEEYGLVIWWLLAVGIAVGVLPRVRPGRLVLVLCGTMLAYAGWTALSLIWTQSSERTFEEIARSLDYLGLLLLLGMVLGRDTWRAAAAGLGFGALAVCVLAVASRLDPAAFPTDAVAITFKTDRLDYPFGYWNAVAAWGAMSTAIGLAWSAHDRVRARRAVALGLVPAAVLATYLSYSRTGVAGSALGVVLVFAASRNRATVLAHAAVAAGGGALAILAVRGAPQIAHGTGDRGSMTVAAALIGATVLSFATAWLTGRLGVDGWHLPRRAARRLAAASLLVALTVAAVVGSTLARNAWHSFTRAPEIASTSDPSARLLSLGGPRYAKWKSALAEFDAHPLDGTGAGTFEFWWNRHSGGDPQFVRDAHNLWLQNMGELGLPGLTLIVAVALAAVAVGVTVRRNARRSTSMGIATGFLAAFAVFLLDASVDWMWQSTAITVLALAGVAVAGARLARPGPQLAWWVRAGLVALALGAAAVQLPGLLSTTDIRRSQVAERAGNGNLALAWANDAVDVEPWSASAYQQKGLVLEAAGRFAAAALALRQAVSHEPTNYVHWLILARVESERGRIGVALADYKTAHRLRPDSPAFALVQSVAVR